MRCLGIYDRVQHLMVEKVEDRTEHDAGPYFDELERMGHVMARTRTHPATRALFDGGFADREVVCR